MLYGNQRFLMKILYMIFLFNGTTLKPEIKVITLFKAYCFELLLRDEILVLSPVGEEFSVINRFAGPGTQWAPASRNHNLTVKIVLISLNLKIVPIIPSVK